MPPVNGDQLRGHLEMLILATLQRNGDAHGLEILRRLEDGGCGLLKLKEGSLYPALYRLEADGQVKAVWEKDTHGRKGARRRIYQITRKGQGRLAKARGEFEQFVSVIGSILGTTNGALA
jgi:DNA-binding PadR family transcriptional regulator